MENQSERIPLGWINCYLKEVAYVRSGYAFKSKDYASEGIPLIRISNIQNGKVQVDKSVCIPNEKIEEDFIVENGDVLVALSGATTGKAGRYISTGIALQNQRTGNIKPFRDDCLDKNYLWYIVLNLKKRIEDAAYGGAQPNLSPKQLENFPVLLPPLTEEELAELPELPEGWGWVKLDEIGSLFSGQSPNTADVNNQGNGIPYVTGPEQWDGTSVELNKWTTNPKKVVPDGCIFITVKGAGVGKLFPGIKSAIGRDISAYYPSNYLFFDFMLFALKYTIDKIISKAIGDIPGLSRNHILEHVIALPSFSEQQKMAELLTNSFSVLDHLTQAIDSALARADLLRQSILKKAFSGKLVPQDPNDEPASELLKRIRAKREKVRATGRSPQRRRRK